jgi:Zinc finger, C2H2 type
LGLNGEEPVQCDICKKVLKRRGNLREHLKMVHQKLVRFHCQFCQRGFYNRQWWASLFEFSLIEALTSLIATLPGKR